MEHTDETINLDLSEVLSSLVSKLVCTYPLLRRQSDDRPTSRFDLASATSSRLSDCLGDNPTIRECAPDRAALGSRSRGPDVVCNEKRLPLRNTAAAPRPADIHSRGEGANRQTECGCRRRIDRADDLESHDLESFGSVVREARTSDEPLRGATVRDVDGRAPTFEDGPVNNRRRWPATCFVPSHHRLSAQRSDINPRAEGPAGSTPG
jgi:hypothetical protein